MIGKLSILLLVAVAISANPANPAANTKWRWIHRTISESPDAEPLPLPESVANVPPRHSEHVGKSSQGENCGRAPLYPPSAQDPAIVGGTNAAPHEFPWQCGLFIDDMYFCGGSLISNKWVLTAAHCVDGATFITVVMGAHNISANETSQVTETSTVYIKHEAYSIISLLGIIKNDIALIELPEAVEFDNFIQPVCLPVKDYNYLEGGEPVTASGWGKTSSDTNTKLSSILNKVALTTLDSTECILQYYTQLPFKNQICTTAPAGKGVCDGDSGGPLNYKPQGGTFTETQGIDSFGPSQEGCESGYANVFTRVEAYLGWIEAKSGVTR